MIELKWIGICSSAKVAAVIGAELGLAIGVLLFIVVAQAFAFNIAMLIFIAAVLLAPVLAVIAVEFGIILYDIVARVLGGAGLDIRGDELKKIDLSSYMRIALPLNLIYLLLFFAATFGLAHTDGLESAGLESCRC